MASIARPKPSREAPVPTPSIKNTLVDVPAETEAPLAVAVVPKLKAETEPAGTVLITLRAFETSTAPFTEPTSICASDRATTASPVGEELVTQSPP